MARIFLHRRTKPVAPRLRRSTYQVAVENGLVDAVPKPSTPTQDLEKSSWDDREQKPWQSAVNRLTGVGDYERK